MLVADLEMLSIAQEHLTNYPRNLPQIPQYTGKDVILPGLIIHNSALTPLPTVFQQVIPSSQFCFIISTNQGLSPLHYHSMFYVKCIFPSLTL